MKNAYWESLAIDYQFKTPRISILQQLTAHSYQNQTSQQFYILITISQNINFTA